MTTNVINKGWFNPISFSVLLVLIFVSVVLYAMEIVNTQVFLLLIIFAGLLASSIRIADQWERAVVLRMGKFKGLRGPGPFRYSCYRQCVCLYRPACAGECF